MNMNTMSPREDVLKRNPQVDAAELDAILELVSQVEKLGVGPVPQNTTSPFTRGASPTACPKRPHVTAALRG